MFVYIGRAKEKGFLVLFWLKNVSKKTYLRRDVRTHFKRNSNAKFLPRNRSNEMTNATRTRNADWFSGAT